MVARLERFDNKRFDKVFEFRLQLVLPYSFAGNIMSNFCSDCFRWIQELSKGQAFTNNTKAFRI
jgi:hypothetical protein